MLTIAHDIKKNVNKNKRHQKLDFNFSKILFLQTASALVRYA